MDVRTRGQARRVALVAVAVLVVALQAGCSDPAPPSGPATTAGPPGGGGATTSSPPASSAGRPTADGSTEAPAPGSTASVLPSTSQSANKPTRKLTGSTSTVAPRLTARLGGLRTAKVKSTVPGEVSGEAVIFDIDVVNGTARTVDLSNVVVNVEGSDGTPASEVTSSPAESPPKQVRAGRTATGRYAFLVPEDDRDPITVSVTLSADTKIAVFRGAVR